MRNLKKNIFVIFLILFGLTQVIFSQNFTIKNYKVSRTVFKKRSKYYDSYILTDTIKNEVKYTLISRTSSSGCMVKTIYYKSWDKINDSLVLTVRLKGKSTYIRKLYLNNKCIYKENLADSKSWLFNGFKAYKDILSMLPEKNTTNR